MEAKNATKAKNAPIAELTKSMSAFARNGHAFALPDVRF
jgi:hypothetical protein